jgi:hypothetical protein
LASLIAHREFSRITLTSIATASGLHDPADLRH